MPIIILTALLALLKLVDVEFLADMSWWWIAGLFAAAFTWFEFIEPTFGLDKRRAHKHSDEIREKRVKKAFAQHGRVHRK